MITPEVSRLLKLLKDNSFGIQSIRWSEERGYADLRVYSLQEDQQDNATKDEGKQGS